MVRHLKESIGGIAVESTPSETQALTLPGKHEMSIGRYRYRAPHLPILGASFLCIHLEASLEKKTSSYFTLKGFDQPRHFGGEFGREPPRHSVVVVGKGVPRIWRPVRNLCKMGQIVLQSKINLRSKRTAVEVCRILSILDIDRIWEKCQDCRFLLRQGSKE